MDQTHCTSFMTKYQVEQLLTIPSKATQLNAQLAAHGVTDFFDLISREIISPFFVTGFGSQLKFSASFHS